MASLEAPAEPAPSLCVAAFGVNAMEDGRPLVAVVLAEESSHRL